MTRVATGATAASMIPDALKAKLRSPTVQTGIGALAGAWLTASLRATRWSVEAEELFATARAGKPLILAFWHECLPTMPAIVRAAGRARDARIGYVLASRHRDGQLVVNAMRAFGLAAISASTSRGGAAGLRELARLVRAGHPIAMTPDGPRGPRRRAAAGVAQLAALTGAPVFCAGAATSCAIGLDTWDAMRLPLPFGRGALVASQGIIVPRDGWKAMMARIEAEMTRTLDLALTRCR